MQKNITAPQPTLEEVSIHFKNWRQIKIKRRDPIPKKLWQEAIDLTLQYPLSTISKELHLRYLDFKERINASIPEIKDTEINPNLSYFILQ